MGSHLARSYSYATVKLEIFWSELGKIELGVIFLLFCERL